jgi:hypothetical protein
MKTEIKPARSRAPYGFAKWEPPAKFLRESPREHRNIPFLDDDNYIKIDKFDRWVAIALSFGVGVWLFVTAYELWGIQ